MDNYTEYQRAEAVHIQLGKDLAKRFTKYTDNTGLKKTHIIKTILSRYLDARERGEKLVKIELF